MKIYLHFYSNEKRFCLRSRALGYLTPIGTVEYLLRSDVSRYYSKYSNKKELSTMRRSNLSGLLDDLKYTCRLKMP